MCGIVGIVRFDGRPVEREELDRLNRAQIHRGPDDAGLFLEGGVGLAMRRLSILDLEQGRQPMTSADGHLVIVFNGECYNFRQIRAELQSLGRAFRTDCDTEVVLEGYGVWGAGVLDRMIGMWGLAIYDRRSKELFLARDRLGKKQIYYGLEGGELVFGSEMATLPLHASRYRRVCRSSIGEFLTHSYIAGPHTALEGVSLLPEGHYAKISAGGALQLTRYWDLNAPDGDPVPGNRDEAAEACYALLRDSVRQRLVSDVPVSVMLSSGLDSSAIGYLLAQELDAPLQAFSIGFGDRDFDEAADSGAFARQMGIPWQTAHLTGEAVADHFENLIDHSSSLQGNTAQIIYYHVNRMIGEAGFKVALNGSGGDELFAGYRTYQADTLFKVWRRLPGWLQKSVTGGVSLMPAQMGRVSLDYMLKQFTRCPYDSPSQAHGYWRHIFSTDELTQLLDPTIPAHPAALYDRAFGEIGGDPEIINTLLRADLKAWLGPMLPWVDNVSMAHSVELRLPFLDHRLVQKALNLPPHMLFQGWKLKGLMKRFLNHRLPHDTLHRRKRGTHLPLGRWLNGPLAELADHYLSPETVQGHGLMDPTMVANLLQAHREGRQENTFKLWNLIVLNAWMERFGISG
ncbi:MAG: asparagine synthase (glutamine-hydrolyzing) [Magnetococcales bacterium]|nr:asparagine synthase (glutamine-hydrolyzing) [Magnetococcales bacterium]